MALEILSNEHNSPEWYDFRKTGIGGSDAAAILGLSPWRTNVDVWEEKVGIKVPDDISDKEAVKYGKAAEDLLVQLFALDCPTYKVTQNKSVVYRRGFMFASLDAELEDDENVKGFLEVKATEPHSAIAFSKWDKQVPEYYYAQLLHYFIVTGWDYAILNAQIKSEGNNGLPRARTERYPFRRETLKEDMRYLYLAEKRFWGYVERKERPPLLLPDFRRN